MMENYIMIIMAQEARVASVVSCVWTPTPCFYVKAHPPELEQHAGDESHSTGPGWFGRQDGNFPTQHVAF
jgi:hypothetical protein